MDVHVFIYKYGDQDNVLFGSNTPNESVLGLLSGPRPSACTDSEHPVRTSCTQVAATYIANHCCMHVITHMRAVRPRVHMTPLKIPPAVRIVVGSFPDRNISGHPVCGIVMVRSTLQQWEMISRIVQHSSLAHREHAIRVKALMVRYTSDTSQSSRAPAKWQRGVMDIQLPEEMADEVQCGFRSAVLAFFDQVTQDLVTWSCQRATQSLLPGMSAAQKAMRVHSAWKHAEEKCFESLLNSDVVRSLGRRWMRLVMHRWLAHGARKWVTATYGTWIEAACAFCGNYRANHHSLLSMCCGCERRLYCSRECQRFDWGAHKRFCGHTGVACGEQDIDYQLRYLPNRYLPVDVIALRSCELGSVIMAGRVRGGVPFAVACCVREGDLYNCYRVRPCSRRACLVATNYIAAGEALVCVCEEFEA